MATRIGRTSILGLLLRHLRHAWAPALGVGLLVLISSAMVAAAPGALERIGRSELRYDVNQLSAGQRDLTAQTSAHPILGPGPDPSGSGLPADSARVWGALQTSLQHIEDQALSPLRGQLSTPRFTAYASPLVLPQSSQPADVVGQLRISLAADPLLARSARLVSGTWPSTVSAGSTAPIGMTLSVATAQRMGWRVGEIRAPQGEPSLRLQLTGTFDAVSATDDYWTINSSILQPDDNPTLGADIITGTGFVAADAWPAVLDQVAPYYVQIFYPFDADSVPVAQIGRLQAQLTGFISITHPFEWTGQPRFDDLIAVSLLTSSPPLLRATSSKISSADAVLSILILGPIGAALGALILACRMLMARRRPAFALLTQRGCTRWRLRLFFAAEGLLVAVPAAAIGATAAGWLLPADRWWPALLAVLAVAMIPGLALAVGLRTRVAGRSDLNLRAGSRWRRIAELAVVLVAVAATLLLYRSEVGVAPGIDPLVALTPLVLCLAGCLVILRLLPLPLTIVHNMARKRPGVTWFVGSARALRDPSVGLTPVLSVLLGVAMAVLSAIVLSTLNTGVDLAARATVGADLRVDRPQLLPGDVAAIRSVPGVAAATTLTTVGDVQVQVAGLEQAVTVYFVDSKALAAIQSDVIGAVPVPSGMTDVVGAAVPVVVSKDLAGSALSIAGHPLAVRGSASSTAGLGRGSGWLLVDSRFLATFGAGSQLPEAMLIQLQPGAAGTQVGDRIDDAVPGALISSAAEAAATLGDAPVVRGVQAVVLAMLVIMGLLCTATVLMTMVAGAGARRGVVSTLRILGLRPSAIKALVAWELLPATITALLGGAGIGVALAKIVTDVVDLRPFTGGALAPAVSVQWPLLAGLLGGFIVFVGVATLLGAARSGRSALAITLRFGDN